jgi:integrase
MGLYKRGSVWWMSFSHNGRQFRRSTETEDRKLAIRIFDKLKGELAEGKWFEKVPVQKHTFGELMDKYLQEHSSVNKVKKSHLRDKGMAKNLLRFFKNRNLTDITSAMISDYKVKRRKDGVSPRTINYELTMMSHAFNLASLEWEWVKDNPVRRVRKDRVHNFIERWLTSEEEKRLLCVSAPWLRDIIIFAIHTGLRQSEILDLRWSQIDLVRRTMTIFEQKNRGIDTLPLNETAVSVLTERYRHRSSEFDHVFPSANNTRIDNMNLVRAFKRVMRKAEVHNFRFHDLRHTFATRLVQSGVGIYEVQRLGRWKSPSMVMRYAHHNIESLRASIEVMDRFEGAIITNLSHPQKNRGHKSHLRLVNP